MTSPESDFAKHLDGARLAVIGYGSQGRAQAQNLKDSGADVAVGLRNEGSASCERAKSDGLEVQGIKDAVKGADLVAILTPDMSHPRLFEESIRPDLKPGGCLLFAHGFSVHNGRLALPQDVDVVLVAPKGPGDLVRKEYVRGRGVPCLYAVHQDATGKAVARAQAYAGLIGGNRGGLIETSFAEETETDLFGEQAVLCGGVKELVKAGYETLTAAGYQSEVAYFECMHELKLIVDLFYEGGLSRMHEFVSETAKYGALTGGPRVVDDHVRSSMAKMLADIRSGAFAKEWIVEHESGLPNYSRLLKADRGHAIEEVGARLRRSMQWLNDDNSSRQNGAPRDD